MHVLEVVLSRRGWSPPECGPPCRKQSPFTWVFRVCVFVGKMNVEGEEVKLIEQAFIKLTQGIYPEGSTKNEKRVIRKKASTLDVIDGVLHYKKKNGKRVSFLFS